MKDAHFGRELVPILRSPQSEEALLGSPWVNNVPTFLLKDGQFWADTEKDRTLPNGQRNAAEIK